MAKGRAPAGGMQGLGRHPRRTSLRNGKFVGGPKKGRVGMAGGGRVKKGR